MEPIREFKTGLAVPWGFTEPDQAISLLTTYYSTRLTEDDDQPWLGPGKHAGYTGAYFDLWEGETDPHPNHFTQEDILAVQMLSVRVPAWAVLDLTERRHSVFADLLGRIPLDVDLWETDDQAEQAIADALELEKELRRYFRVGATTAAKLIARKRPRLYPIYDSVVVGALGLDGVLFHQLRKELIQSPELRQLCAQLRAAAGLPDSISILRVFDVVTWMGQDRGSHRLEDPEEE